ncbi:MAG: LOG family protein [Pseudobdellovibrionaceae bacterium]|jgi:uncharacterized protein (TIGR00730 family)|nr:LOG family protein [Pseudobdellovibrionaceae bacterium]
MKSFTYFSGAHKGNKPEYLEAAHKVGTFLGKKGCFAKYGGSKTGLMGEFCFAFLDAVKEHNSAGRILGILPQKYFNVNRPDEIGIEYLLTETLSERKHELIKDVDAFLVMPGGIGTLDEIFETVETDYKPADRDPTIGDYSIRPIFILNLFGYYDATKAQLDHMVEEGFLIPKKIENIFFIDTIENYIALLDQYIKR